MCMMISFTCGFFLLSRLCSISNDSNDCYPIIYIINTIIVELSLDREQYEDDCYAVVQFVSLSLEPYHIPLLLLI